MFKERESSLLPGKGEKRLKKAQFFLMHKTGGTVTVTSDLMVIR